MNRNAILIDENTHRTVRIYVDALNAETILSYVFRDKVDEEFKEIRALLKEALRNREKYCKCDVSDQAKDMFEMRFTRHRRNDRIYCKEISSGKARHIIMVELLEKKKTQQIDKNTKRRIVKMGGYRYEI